MSNPENKNLKDGKDEGPAGTTETPKPTETPDRSAETTDKAENTETAETTETTETLASETTAPTEPTKTAETPGTTDKTPETTGTETTEEQLIFAVGDMFRDDNRLYKLVAEKKEGGEVYFQIEEVDADNEMEVWQSKRALLGYLKDGQINKIKPTKEQGKEPLSSEQALEQARRDYIDAGKEMRKFHWHKEKRKKAEENFIEAQKAYRKFEGEHNGWRFDKFLDAQIALLDEQGSKGSSEKNIIYRGYKKLGDWNITNLIEKKSGKEIENKLLRTAGNFVSVRSAVSGALLGLGFGLPMLGFGAGSITGTGLFLAKRGFSGVGAGVGSRDLLHNLKEFGAKKLGRRRDYEIQQSNLANWDKEEILEKMAHFERAAVLNGKEVSSDKAYQNLVWALKEKIKQEPEIENVKKREEAVYKFLETYDAKSSQAQKIEKRKERIISGASVAIGAFVGSAWWSSEAREGWKAVGGLVKKGAVRVKDLVVDLLTGSTKETAEISGVSAGAKVMENVSQAPVTSEVSGAPKTGGGGGVTEIQKPSAPSVAAPGETAQELANKTGKTVITIQEQPNVEAPGGEIKPGLPAEPYAVELEKGGNLTTAAREVLSKQDIGDFTQAQRVKAEFDLAMDWLRTAKEAGKDINPLKMQIGDKIEFSPDKVREIIGDVADRFKPNSPAGLKLEKALKPFVEKVNWQDWKVEKIAKVLQESVEKGLDIKSSAVKLTAEQIAQDNALKDFWHTAAEAITTEQPKKISSFWSNNKLVVGSGLGIIAMIVSPFIIKAIYKMRKAKKETAETSDKTEPTAKTENTKETIKRRGKLVDVLGKQESKIDQWLKRREFAMGKDKVFSWQEIKKFKKKQDKENIVFLRRRLKEEKEKLSEQENIDLFNDLDKYLSKIKNK